MGNIKMRVSGRSVLESVLETPTGCFVNGHKVKILDRTVEIESTEEVSSGEDVCSLDVAQRSVSHLFRVHKPSAIYKGKSLKRPNGYRLVGVSSFTVKKGLVYNGIKGDWVEIGSRYNTSVVFYKYLP
jgi:hypothetical protein